jgi:sensor histidine kinase YesM
MQYQLNINNPNDFVFSSKYRLLRHVIFWIFQIVIFSFVWKSLNYSVSRTLFQGVLWVLPNMVFCYPLVYWVLPQYLLKGKYVQFAFIILLWAIAGFYLNYLFRAYFFIPLQEYIGFDRIAKDPWAHGSFLKMTTTAGIACMIVLFRHWLKKQQEWREAEKGKIVAELELLKAQVHPHFLFNTLNNIYSFSLENSPKTPGLILKLSSLLSYMLYECKAEEVLLEKELEVMRNYIDLERERYGSNIEISWNIEGEVKGKYISPLLLLPFIENAFKHGTSEQLEKPWLSVDILVEQDLIKCKVINSKNQYVAVSEGGIGIQNVKKRLSYLHPNKYELKINDEGEYFIASLMVELKNHKAGYTTSSYTYSKLAEKASA